MVNCNYIGGQNNDEYDRFVVIINEKNIQRRNCLVGIQNRILLSYELYLENFEVLQASQGSILAQHEINEREYLNHCYSVKTNTFKHKRGEIFDSQSIQLKAFCPYCLLNKPTTLDHYIGKTEYPEYSILLKNLIPCCYHCNQKKRENWRRNSRRRYIHFYNDTFLNNRFLFANLIFHGNDVPDISYELIKPNNITQEQFEIVTFHFEDLRLIEEYIERSNAILSTEISIIHNSNQRGDTIESIRQTFIDKHENIIGFGINYWQKCMYEAIALNIENILLIN